MFEVAKWFTGTTVRYISVLEYQMNYAWLSAQGEEETRPERSLKLNERVGIWHVASRYIDSHGHQPNFNVVKLIVLNRELKRDGWHLVKW